MNLIQRIEAIDTQIPESLSKYSDVFEGLGCITDVIYHIELNPGSKPVVHPPRRVPVTLRSMAYCLFLYWQGIMALPHGCSGAPPNATNLACDGSNGLLQI